MVKVDRFVFPVDFVILEMEEDQNMPLILGRPFLATSRALIDMDGGKLTLRVGDEEVVCGIRKSTKDTTVLDDPLQVFNVIDSHLDYHLKKNWKESRVTKHLDRGAVDVDHVQVGGGVSHIPAHESSPLGRSFMFLRGMKDQKSKPPDMENKHVFHPKNK